MTTPIPSDASQAVELPPLPDGMRAGAHAKDLVVFHAFDMQAYARAAIAQDRAARAQAEPVADTELHGLDTAERVCFYEQDFYVLSNFSSFNLRLHGYDWPTSEHAYHAEKFRNLRGDISGLIARAPSAHEAFKIAERYRHNRRRDWDEVKVDVMREILREKARQHEYVRRKLLATGNRELVENSWRDDYWGWGPNRDGQNMLGKLWMEVRAELRSADESPVAPTIPQAAEVPSEWTARRSIDGLRVVIDSADFEHDMLLTLTGDFESEAQKLWIAGALADKLNAAAPTPTASAPKAEAVTCERCGHENWVMEGKAPCQITAADKQAAQPPSEADRTREGGDVVAKKPYCPGCDTSAQCEAAGTCLDAGEQS